MSIYFYNFFVAESHH